MSYGKCSGHKSDLLGHKQLSQKLEGAAQE
jgi:hypothetical protein